MDGYGGLQVGLQVLVHGFNETVHRDRWPFLHSARLTSIAVLLDPASQPPSTASQLRSTRILQAQIKDNDGLVQHRIVWVYDASARISRGTTFMAIICSHGGLSSISAFLYGRE